MEEKVKERRQRSYERYCSYDLQVWSLAFFDKNTGGYVVVDLRRIAHSEKSKNEGKKYRDELEMATVFATRAASRAIRKQNARVVLFQFDTNAERVYLELLKISRKGWKVLYFFTDEKIVYNLDTATPQQLLGRGGDPSAPCGGDRSVNYFS